MAKEEIVIKIYRLGNKTYKLKNPIVKKFYNILYKVSYFTISKLLFNCEILAKANIGKNLQLPHHGNGVIIDNATIGDNVIIRPQVIIGKTIKGGSKAPTIGNNVDIGVGAKVLGNITIGDNVMIGANAVILKDVPSNCTVVGIPGKIVKTKDSSNSDQIYIYNYF